MNQPSIWIIGMDAPLDEINGVCKTAGMILVRGNLAARWLTENDLKAFEPLLMPQELSSAEEYLHEFYSRIKNVFHNGQPLIYVTEANPLSADGIATRLVKEFPAAEFHWKNGSDLAADPLILSILANAAGLTVLDGMTFGDRYHIPFDASQTVLIYYPDAVLGFDRLSQLLKDVYLLGHEVCLLFERADGKITWNQMKIEELAVIHTPVAAMLVPPRAADSSLVSFEELIAHLRAPNGCPWDKKQTHDSLRTYLLEETYEALDALDQHDMAGLQEELGDIVLQIALHAQIATEAHEFTMADVLEGINRKIVYRHPHVFGDAVVNGEKGVLQNWEKLKQQERAGNGDKEEKGLLEGIPVSFPALAQAQAIQDRAARVGFDWKEIEPVIAKVFEEFEEVKTAPNEEERAKELGDLLFAVVNLVRWYHVDAESALRGTNLKFRRRFGYIEKKSRAIQKPMQEMNLDEMDSYWDEAKKLE
jgi:tetrapyrrole methylase family protein/MazG family protein